MNRLTVVLLGVIGLLSACSGGGQTAATTPPTTAPTTTTNGTCSLRNRQNFAFATLKEWYLFPETLPTTLDPTPYANVDDYIDALTATARAQRRDRFFTYLASIAEEDAFFSSGATAGFGFRLSYDDATQRVLIVESFEGTSALGAGVDRGDVIVGIGTTTANVRTVSSIIASEGLGGVGNAFGPDTVGTTRILRLTGTGGSRDVTVSKTNYELSPVSSRYGAKIIDDGGRKVGYVNLRTFIKAGDAQLRTAFATFRAAGITEYIIDLRYNGGGLVASSDLFGDLLGQNRAASDIFSQLTFRPEKSIENSVHRFLVQPESVAPTKIAFIGTGATASASELLINGMAPYLGQNLALIGENTFGKPVGQFAIDNTACDDRVRVIAFATTNSTNTAEYFDGLAATLPVTCRAGDDLTKPLGDPSEASVRQALDYLAGLPCTAIGSAPAASAQRAAKTVAPGTPEMMVPAAPSVAQREVPGLF